MELHGTFETDNVLGLFRETGSFDPDVLDWRKSELLHRARAATRAGNRFVLFGLIAVLSLVGAPIGAVLLFAGWQLRRRGADHVRAVKRAFEKYTRPHSFGSFGDSQPEGGSQCSVC